MKKTYLVLLVIVLSLFILVPIGSFAFGLAANAGHIAQLIGLVPPSPLEQYGSLWVSEEPPITIHVAEEGSYKGYTAYVTQDGEQSEVSVILERMTFEIRTRDYGSVNGRFLRGEIRKQTEDEVLIAVTEDRLFGGTYETITLRRAD